MSVVRLVRIDGSRLEVEGVDMLDGTPLLDIKPYVPEFDVFVGSRSGWLCDSPVKRKTADTRFEGTHVASLLQPHEKMQAQGRSGGGLR